jgi:hypothetical protein
LLGISEAGVEFHGQANRLAWWLVLISAGIQLTIRR